MTRASRTSSGLVQLTSLVVVTAAVGAWLAFRIVGLAAPLTHAPGTFSTRLAVLGLDHAVALPLAAIGVLACLWLAGHGLVGIVYLLGVRLGRPSERLATVLASRSPALVRSIARRAVGAGVGLGIGASAVLGVATTASAAPLAPVAQSVPVVHDVSVPHDASVGRTAQPADGGAHTSRVASTIDLGWHQTARPGATPGARPAARPKTTARTPAASAAASATASATHVVVRRGDTLWSIAAAHLGAHATDADIARAWPRWYAANHRLIGADPDHILPGTVLTVPSETG